MYFWTLEQDAFLRDNYKKLQAKEIALHVCRSESAVQGRADALGLKKGYKKYSHNETFFFVPDVLNSYWAGMIAADGCIRNNNLLLSLKFEDGYHVEKLANDLSYTGIVKERASKGHKISIIEICGADKIVKDLDENFSVTTQKSLTLKPPNLQNLDHKLAFIKGYWDGDGCIRLEKERLEVSCCGTLEMLTWIQELFDQLVPPYGKYHALARLRKSGKNHADYKITGHRAESIFRRLHDLETPELDRKWSVMDNYKCRVYDKKCYDTWKSKFWQGV